MKFTLQHKDPSSQARAGELQTDHGVVKTPIFMPVGTAATVKGIFHRDVRDEARAQIILANTYHLYLRPGMDILERAGGVHRFSTWDGPMLTDSGKNYLEVMPIHIMKNIMKLLNNLKPI